MEAHGKSKAIRTPATQLGKVNLQASHLPRIESFCWPCMAAKPESPIGSPHSPPARKSSGHRANTPPFLWQTYVSNHGEINHDQPTWCVAAWSVSRPPACKISAFLPPASPVAHPGLQIHRRHHRLKTFVPVNINKHRTCTILYLRGRTMSDQL